MGEGDGDARGAKGSRKGEGEGGREGRRGVDGLGAKLDWFRVKEHVNGFRKS
jgi:hypothetical protein